MSDELLTRKLPGASSTLDVEQRTVEVVLATETPVRRQSWKGVYDEILRVSQDAIDASRLNGLPILDSHKATSIENRIGSIVAGSIRIQNSELIGQVKLCRSPIADRILQDLADGHRLSVSVGYRITKSEIDEAIEPPTVTATRWSPHELSVVCVPADPAAHSRSFSQQGTPSMNQKVENTPSTAPTDDDMQQRAVKAERDRSEMIADLGRKLGMKDEFIRKHQAAGTSIANYREMVLDMVAERDEHAETFEHVGTSQVMGGYNNSRRIDLQAAALAYRANAGLELPAEAVEFRHMRLIDHASMILESGGTSVRGLSQNEIVSRALHTTSDFPVLLSNAMGKTLQAAYQEAGSGLKTVAHKTLHSDFKRKSKLRLSAAENLEKVNEHGEYRRSTFTESEEGFRLLTYGKIFGLTRRAAINDDLSAFESIGPAMARSAARTEDELLTALIVDNPELSDNVPVFHADHANLAAAGAALSVQTLSDARLSMRRQTGIAGERLNISPKYLIVSPEQETVAEQLLSEIQASQVDEVNPWARRLQLIVSPFFEDGDAWYLAADQSNIPGLEYAYLAGAEGVELDTRVGFDIDGIEWRARLDFGCGWVDHRGWYLNPGA